VREGNLQQTLAILFADIAGSTELYERVGDVEAHRRVAESLTFMADAVSNNSGTVLRTVGDSTLASFDDCNDALHAATEMQKRHKTTPLSVRVGFHFGPVIPDKGDVYGNAVNIAARVASYAKTDEITATEQTVALLNTGNRAKATLLDTINVKGISEAMGVYRVAWETDESMHTRVAAPVNIKHAQNEDRFMEISANLKSCRLDKHSGDITIGRDTECVLQMNGDRVSRHHAQISWRAGQLILTDSSTNGTYVQRNGQAALFVRRESVVLEDAGQLGMGIMASDDLAHTIAYKIVEQ
jgi:class 3 adenylate cyclase